MTVPLDTRNDIRSMDAEGLPRAEIARRLHLSRGTVAKYADMEDLSPAPPVPEPRPHPALEGHAGWVDAVLEADLGAPRKQRHTAKRIYDRLVSERGYRGSYSTVQRHVREWRLARGAGAGGGYLELEWAPGTAQVDYGNFEAEVAGERLRLKLLVVCLPHSGARYAVAGRSQRAECMCAGLASIFGWVGRAPRELVLDNATEAGRRVRGEVTESHLFSLFRAHYRAGSRYCNPYSGNEKGAVENAVGFLRRNLLVPVPRVGSLAELNALLREGCDRLNASSRARDGRPTPEALSEDLASDARAALGPLRRRPLGEVPRRQARRGDGRRPGLPGRAGLALQGAPRRRAGGDGRGPRRPRPRVALLPRAFGDGPAVRNPLSLVPALVARPRAFGESVIRRDMPEGLVRAIDSLDARGRRRVLRAIGRAAAASGFDAACAAAQGVLDGGRVPDDATVDVLARRIASGALGEAGGADLSVYDGFLRGGGDRAC